MDPTAAQIVAGLPVAERIRLLSGRDFWHVEPVEEAGLPAVMVADGPHGLRKQQGAADRVELADSVPATCFPPAAGLAATWDEALLEEVGRALGRECRAEGVGVLLGPGLNLKRHPAGGRNFEYLSEDPVVSGRMAAALVRGVQAEGVGTSVKHYVANNHETCRMVVDVVVDERTLRELYLAGFEAVVREAAPWTVMCAYNRVNGEYCSDSRRLLTGILRDEWGFDGLVMTDWGATNDRVTGVAAGLDLEMPGTGGPFDASVAAALEDGTLAEADLDRAATRVVDLLTRARDGAATDPGGPCDADAHHDLARRTATAATVLLTNDGTLPLAPTARIAVVGSFAVEPRYQGTGSSKVTPTRLDTALDALRARLGGDASISYAPGYDPSTGEATDALVDDAVARAAAADVVVVFAGLPGTYESEGFDRADLRLPEGHTRVVKSVLAANPATVVVLSGGAPVEMAWADRPAALVHGYLGGQAGGSAIVDVLLGDAEPGGRLAESIPVEGSDLPADRNFPRPASPGSPAGTRGPRQVEYREGLYVGYRFHDTAGVPARFAFGHGLSYTTFAYGGLSVEGSGPDISVAFTVTNTGDRAGSEVAQVYVRDVESTVHRPDKELRDFAKVHLDPGGSETVRVALGPRAFAFYDVGTADWQIEAGEFEILVGSSSVDIRASVTIVVESDFVPEPTSAPADLVADDRAFAAALGRAVPVAAPSLPFSRTSTVGDLVQTRIGRALRAVVLRVAAAEADRLTADDDETTRRMIESMVEELPLRNLAAMSRGRISLNALDGIIDALNGRWRTVVDRLRRPG